MNGRNKPPLGAARIGPASVPDDGLSDERAGLRAKLDAASSWRVRRKLEAALAALNQPEDNRRMQIWDLRRLEIREALMALPRPEKRATISFPLVMDILNEAAFSMPLDSQRMRLTQAELADQLGVSPETVTRAFAMLSHDSVRAVLNRQFCRKSLTWEIDAAFASRLGPTQRIAALKAQDEWYAKRDREAREAEAKAKRSFRIVPGGMDGIAGADEGAIDDERQAALLEDAE